jgi:hypothetical protein
VYGFSTCLGEISLDRTPTLDIMVRKNIVARRFLRYLSVLAMLCGRFGAQTFYASKPATGRLEKFPYPLTPLRDRMQFYSP